MSSEFWKRKRRRRRRNERSFLCLFKEGRTSEAVLRKTNSFALEKVPVVQGTRDGNGETTVTATSSLWRSSDQGVTGEPSEFQRTFLDMLTHASFLLSNRPRDKLPHPICSIVDKKPKISAEPWTMSREWTVSWKRPAWPWPRAFRDTCPIGREKTKRR